MPRGSGAQAPPTTVNYVDFTLVRLADATTRAGLFDPDALEQLAGAAYGPDAATLSGPYSAVFDELQMGVWIDARSIVHGWWAIPGAARTETQLVVAGFGGATSIRIDAMWRGAIVARAAPVSGKIIEESASWPPLRGIDDEIAAALGGLPADGAVLEAERRSRYLARARATLRHPAALTDAVFDAWLDGAGVASVSDLMARSGATTLGTIKVRYGAPAAPSATTPRRLPVTAAIMLRDAISLADVLAQSRSIRQQLREAGAARAHDDDLGAAPVLAVWMVPETVFDDNDWPGGTSGTPAERRLARRRAAATWLGPEGIALVPTAKHP